MIKIRAFIDIIKQICQEEKISLKQFSDNWIMQLTKNGISKYIVGYKFDINSSCTSEICNDKCALFSILENSAIPIINHNILFKNNEGKLNELFNRYNKDIVIKPNTGTCGNNVYHIKSQKEAINIYNKIISYEDNVCVCPFYNIKNEYRAIFLNDKIQYAYKKVKPVVIGNGQDNLKELLLDFNEAYFKKESNFKNSKFDLKYIPQRNEIIEYEWRFNLSRGSKIDEIDQYEEEMISSISKAAAKEINLKFGSIDIIETYDKQYKIIEINSGVMMENLINLKENGKETAKKIYRNAINLMFE